jgi:hypothetical protein
MTVSNAYVATVLEQFLRSGTLAQNVVRTPIAESWMRCYRDGVGADPTRESSWIRVSAFIHPPNNRQRMRRCASCLTPAGELWASQF